MVFKNFIEKMKSPEKRWGEKMMHNVFEFISRYRLHAMNVGESYPNLLTVPNIEDYTTRAVAFMPVLFGEEQKVAIHSSEDMNALIDYFKNNFNIIPKNPQLVTARDNFTYSAILSFLNELQKEGKNKQEIADILFNQVNLFGYSDTVLDAVREAIFDSGIFTDEEAQTIYANFYSKFEKRKTILDEGPNNKISFRSALDEYLSAIPEEKRASLPPLTTPWSVAESVYEDLIKYGKSDFLKKLEGKKVFLKPTVAASGEEVESFDIPQQLEELRNRLRRLHEEEQKDLSQYLIEKGYDGDNPREFSLQFFVSPEKDSYGSPLVYPLAVTKQIIQNHEHQGNIVSFEEDFIKKFVDSIELEHVARFIKFLSREYSYDGYISTDAMGGKKDFILLEANARNTGATAPLMMLAYLKSEYPEKSWYVGSINTLALDSGENMTLEKVTEILKSHGVLYEDNENTVNRRGLIPYLIALPNKIGFLSVSESEDEVVGYLNVAKKLLPLKQ